MKALFDFLPIIMFFVTYKVADLYKTQATQLANIYLDPILPGPPITSTEAPILLATLATLITTLLLIFIMVLRKQKVSKLIWINTAIITILSLATIFLKNEIFIKWKSSVIYWLMGLVFILSEPLTGKNILSTLANNSDISAAIWSKLSLAWGIFFIVLGCLNLYIAYHYPTDVWVNFKLFGNLGLMVIFVIFQSIYIVYKSKSTEQK